MLQNGIPLTEFYHSRISFFEQRVKHFHRKENKLSFARLVTFGGILLLFFGLYGISIAAAISSSVACMIAFGILIKYHAKTEQLKAYYEHLVTINQLELKSLSGDISHYADGKEYTDQAHPYTYDLDIFGHASVFQYVNRTTSKPAADMMARWLMKPAETDEIELRQQAIAELKPLIDWRQKLITLGYRNKDAGNDPEALMNWVKSTDFFIRPKRYRFITLGLSILGAVVTVFLIIYGFPASLLIPVLTVNFMVYFSQSKKIARVHDQVGKSSEMLQTYSETIRLIEEEVFGCTKLTGLRNTFTQTVPVSAQIRWLSQMVSRLDVRLNVMVSIPLNLFFFWDIHCCLALEKWKRDHMDDLSEWFSAMAEFEVLSSLSNMAYNNPTWTMPGIVQDYFVLKGEHMGHPLIPEQRRITNTLEIADNGKTILVTGSNMSGKSTFLRTCGVNAVLALAGAPVCASSFVISHVQVYTSMRISDSLEDNTSSFYAELKRLATIIKEAKHHPRVFLLLDEILRGTNSNDRYIGSVALIKQLIGYNTVAMVATHDLKLADLAGELPDRIDNYHFDVKIEGEELYFDYQLTPGICTSMNASLLMKKMGIRV